jgi:hypothetical protein
MNKLSAIKAGYVFLSLPFTISFILILVAVLNGAIVYSTFGFSIIIGLTIISAILFPFKFRLIKKESWIEVQLHLLTVQVIFSLLNFLIILSIILKLNINTLINTNEWLTVFFLIAFNFGYLYYFHSISNVIGMDYQGYSKKSSLGVTCYAMLSSKFLEQEKDTGLSLLSYSLKSLKKIFETNNQKIEELDTSITMMDNIEMYYHKGTYLETNTLAESLSSYPEMDKIYPSLNNFANNERLKWANKILSKNERIKLKEFLPIVPAAILAFIGIVNLFFPKELIPDIVSNAISSLSSSSAIILFLSSYLLMFVYVRIISPILGEVSLILKGTEKIK